MKTIAQMLGITEFPFVIRDKRGNMIYLETSTGYWSKREYNSRGIETYFETSLGTKCGHPSKIIIDGVTYQKSE